MKKAQLFVQKEKEFNNIVKKARKKNIGEFIQKKTSLDLRL